MKILLSHTTPQFENDFLSLPKAIKAKAKRKIKLFENNSRHVSLNTHRLRGVLKSFWSFSIDKNYRVIFRFLPQKEVIYYRIGLHNIYKKLENIF